ncbi:TPA: AAA family ATPase [Serratia marcescens]|uniref:ATP-dependent nuclease n=1 Tax=Serratia marcescens TaxID=615 RepID=UPI00114EA0F3|nr:AAA family ATPase [Serratia marcescens]QDI16841.1 ATP-dependent endonuclease [Serratia marcescens]QDI26585.1 ATP-dependent endonuclease [Serratia marcescens]QDI41053.1 ATP-dependent endonuclease [Serratia marcescens]QDI55485.1 ATP-dependent endonuclease [Serratia marcescens]HEJ8101154.1 AAA family ATPase [Serratia marcescens]
MHVKSIKLTNFKKFKDEHLEFNDDVNIFVGDNNAGKSTILEALEVVLNYNYRGRPFNTEFTPDIFNKDAVQQFLASDKSAKHLPSLTIEAFIDGVPEYRGTNNFQKVDAQGITVQVHFDAMLKDVYADYLKTNPNITSIPIEFYKLEWLDFGWNPIKAVAKKFRALYIDPTRIHPTLGKNQYISTILNTALNKEELVKLTLNYRENQQVFNNSGEVKMVNTGLDTDHLITDKKLSIAASTLPAGSIQTSLQLEVDDVPFQFIGKGEQSNVQIKLAIQNKSKDIDLVMMEEPENHLSHTNLNKLVYYIERQRGTKQLFLTTHSSYVLNKLSIDKICLVQSGYKRLHKLDPAVVKTLKRLPGYDTLRVALSRNVILVEGPSDELVLKKIYHRKHGRLPEQDGIDIIVVRGVGFDTFISVGMEIGTSINVLRDNDGAYNENIVKARDTYAAYPNIKLISSENDEEFSLEPAMIYANATDLKTLNAFAEEVLSKQTYNLYTKVADLNKRREFLIEWFRSVKGNGKGARKVDSAIRLFDGNLDFKYPAFLDEVFNFG